MFRRVGGKLRRFLPDLRRSHATYGPVGRGGKLRLGWGEFAFSGLRGREAEIAELSKLYCAHRFDLLGSGWVSLAHGEQRAGMGPHRFEAEPPPEVDPEGRWLRERTHAPNYERSAALWRQIGDDYQPIDWQVDFKSGYRWRDSDRSTQIKPIRRDTPGVDIKVPWELGRMQHLPELAYAYHLSSLGRPGFGPPAQYAAEFRNQILDFVATNPPGFGVHWCSSMDVAIRAVNWLVAYGLLCGAGAQREPEFESAIIDSSVDHADHVFGNLEWKPAGRNNHYLSNLAGLILIAAHLPRARGRRRWLKLAVPEFLSEVQSQFAADGSSDERATCYHLLSLEMALFASAALLQMGRDLPNTHLERLARAIEFCGDIEKPSGQIPQFGDGDSGRFLKLDVTRRALSVDEAKREFQNLDGYTPHPGDSRYWVEDPLDPRWVVATARGLFRTHSTETNCVGRDVVSAWCGDRRVHLEPRQRTPEIRRRSEVSRSRSAPGAISDDRVQIYHWPAAPDLREGLRLVEYPDFGLFLIRSERLYLAVLCSSVGLDGLGSHSHVDPLSLELTLDGEDRVTDPGTYVYTPMPELRNQYRGIEAHFAPRPQGAEPENLSRLFRLTSHATPTCHAFDEDGFFGSCDFGDSTVFRRVEIQTDGIIVTDWIEGGSHGLERWESGGNGAGELISPGYGIRYRERRSVRVPSDVSGG